MANLAPIMSFPCAYQLKVIGIAGDEFESCVIPILNKHIPSLKEGAIAYNKSRSDKYVALTISFNANSKAQLDELYRELTAKPQVLMAL